MGLIGRPSRAFDPRITTGRPVMIPVDARFFVSKDGRSDVLVMHHWLLASYWMRSMHLSLWPDAWAVPALMGLDSRG